MPSIKKKQQLVRSNPKIIKSEVPSIMMLDLFNVTVNEIMHLMRDSIDAKIKRQTEALKTEFKLQLNASIDQLIQMIETQIASVIKPINQSIEFFFYFIFSSAFDTSTPPKPPKVENVGYFDPNYKQKKRAILHQKRVLTTPLLTLTSTFITPKFIAL